MKYAFILGRNQELSIAELGAIFQSLRSCKNYAIFFDGELPQKPQDFLNRLGGTTEILEIFAENLPQADILNDVEKFLLEQSRAHTGKCAFALNLWPENKKSQVLKFLLTRLKKNLRAKGVSANFMNKNFQNVSPVFASKQGLIGSKTNIGILDVGDGKVTLGATVALQDFEAYSKRDYGKPFRDPAVGMLPPKLAQIMINLANPNEIASAATILDPFCGTGTILMEAMLMGYSVIGSDKDARLIEGARQNIDWLQKTFSKSVPGNTHVKLFQKDARSLTAADAIAKAPVGGKQQNGSLSLAVVTEPFLGPPLSQFPAENFLKKLMDELEKLYLDFFKNLAQWLPKKTAVVFIFPYWKKGSSRQSLASHVVAKIESLGYSKTTFAPLKTTSLLYERPDSVVGREIVRFVKVVRP
ncbi:hypothetical protein HYW83_05530 [Candidatus Peregrinibacteria bacterium]|nr:hypothetical protein [Candidatus Peregrinibacteria bacterium]